MAMRVSNRWLWVVLIGALGCQPLGGGGGSGGEAGAPMGGAGGEPPPGEPEPSPGEPEPSPGEPEPSPGEPEPSPGEPEPSPGEPEPSPGEPEPDPGEPEPSPGEPEPDPGEPEPDPGGDCAADAECADPLGQTCAEGRCIANPCSRVVFQFDPGGVEYATVHVAGSFNGWTDQVDAGLRLTFDPDRGVWWGKRDFDNGNYQYKFVLYRPGVALPEWVQDPRNPEGVDDGFGGQNSVLRVDCAACAGDGDCPGDLRCVAGSCVEVACVRNDDCAGGGICLEGRCVEGAACDPTFEWDDAVMYFAMVDRFYDSDGQRQQVPGASGPEFGEGAGEGPDARYVGGDLMGLTEKMPYLADLGVTALWITAPFENRDSAGGAIDPNADRHQYTAYHGYWPSPADIRFDGGRANPEPRVESAIGDADDLRTMVDTAHAAASANGQGIKVLFDYVMNHVDIDSGLYRAHPDWFARARPDNSFTTDPGAGNRFRLCGPENLWDDPFWGTRCAFTDYLPAFAFDDAPAALAWSIDDAVWWATAFDIDGYRLDAIKHVPLQWLTALRSRIDRDVDAPAGGRFYLVGETFDYDNRDLLARFVEPGRMLDGQFDFPFKARLCEALFRPDGDLGAFAGWMDGNDGFYGPGAIMTTWIGNHDIPRAIHWASGQLQNCREGSYPGNGWTADYAQPRDAAPYERLGLAFVVMMTNPGIPLIYYGDEIGLAGGGDPDNRRMMIWDDERLLPAQRALRDRVRALARLRARYTSLSRGQRVTREGTSRDVWIYTRLGCSGEPPITVVINKADGARAAQLPPGRYVDLLNDQALVDGGAVELPPRSAMVLRPSVGG